MAIKQIIKGHMNELLNREEQLSNHRLTICRACPLYKEGKFGPVCNPALYLNPDANEVASYDKGKDFHRGCGCRLNAKTRLEDAHCPANKW